MNDRIKRIFTLYQEPDIQPIIERCNITNYPNFDILLKLFPLIPEQQLIECEQWLEQFVAIDIKAYQMIWAENSISYWEQAKALGWGSEYTEMKVLFKCERRIRNSWQDKRNLLPLKRIRLQEKDTNVKQEQTGKQKKQPRPKRIKPKDITSTATDK